MWRMCEGDSYTISGCLCEVTSGSVCGGSYTTRHDCSSWLQIISYSGHSHDG